MCERNPDGGTPPADRDGRRGRRLTVRAAGGVGAADATRGAGATGAAVAPQQQRPWP